MGWFRIIAFIGAASLIVSFAQTETLTTIDIIARTIGAMCLLWGSFYFLLKEEDYLYGISGLVLAIVFQPFFLIPIFGIYWLILDAIGILYLVLAGMLCIRIEKKRALEHARIEAELAGYREREEKYYKAMHRDDH